MSVDLTIYKTGNNVDAANRASINIKNNNEKTQKTGFDGVIVSGMEVDTKKLDKNTYTSLIKQADDVKSQIMQSASDAKANLKALFNRLSGADAVKIDEDGFNLNDATPDDCVNIIERIKIELAAHCDTYTGDMSGIDVSKIEKVVGSAGMAQQVAANMQDTGLPLTDDNISDMAESLSGMGNGSLSEDTKNYLVKNNMQPTIKNIQIAQAASKGFGDKMQTLSRQELEQLMPQIKEIIGKAKLEVNDNNINNAIIFISQDIPVTEQNLVYKNQLDMINLDYDETSLKIAQGMADGSKAEEVSLIKDYDSAVCFYYESLIYADHPGVQAELHHIHTITQKKIVPPTREEINKAFEKYGIQPGANKEVVGVAAALAKEAIEKKDLSGSQFYLLVVYSLTNDPEVKELLEKVSPKKKAAKTEAGEKPIQQTK